MAGRPKLEAASAFSRQIVVNVETLRDEAGMSNAQLIRDSGMSSNYFYTRLRLEAPFNTNDVQKLADALGVDAEELVVPRTASGSRRLHLDGAELGRRLSLLQEKCAPDLDEAELAAAVVEYLGRNDVSFTTDHWLSLLNATGPVRISQRALEEIAAYFDVDSVYLVNHKANDGRERVEAELELRSALRKAGAESVATRALGEASPAALLAIARAINEGPSR